MFTRFFQAFAKNQTFSFLPEGRRQKKEAVTVDSFLLFLSNTEG